jgi:hypothetical protein
LYALFYRPQELTKIWLFHTRGSLCHNTPAHGLEHNVHTGALTLTVRLHAADAASRTLHLKARFATGALGLLRAEEALRAYSLTPTGKYTTLL